MDGWSVAAAWLMSVRIGAGVRRVQGVQAVVAARILDRRWYEQEAERASARFQRALRGANGAGCTIRARGVHEDPHAACTTSLY
jgi:hypothetical protein